MQALNPSTPYNSIYAVLQPQGQEDDVICCMHGLPCEKKGDEDSTTYVNLVPGGRNRSKKSLKKNFNASVGEKLKKLRKGRKDKEERSNGATERGLRRIRNGLKTMEIGRKPAHQKTKEERKKERKGRGEFDVKSERREEKRDKTTESRFRKSRKQAAQEKKKSESSKKRSKSRKSKSQKTEPFESIANLARAARKPNEAKKAYLGICGWQQAEDLASVTGVVTLYHRLEDNTALDFLEADLPLFLLRQSNSGSYRHFRVLRRKSGGKMSYCVEGGVSEPIAHASLDDLVRYFKKMEQSGSRE